MHIAKLINKHLFILLMAVICLGLALGSLYPKSGEYLESFYPITLFIMLYPMMVEIKINEVVKASRRISFIILIMILNYIVSPLLAALLAHIFLSGYPDFAIGLIINGTVPCGGMIVAWTAMSKGNVPMTVVIMVISMLAGIVVIPFWILVLAGQYVPIDAWKMLQTILYTIVGPLLLGQLTRTWLIKKWSEEKLAQIRPIFPAVSAIGLFMVFFIAMVSQSTVLFNNPRYLGLIALPLTAFYFLLLSLIILYARFTRMDYPDMISLFYGVGGKNAAIPLALAVVFFSPLTIFLLAAKLVIQITFLTGFYKITPYLEVYWINVLQIPNQKTI
ncbi:bile acid:sodium symporter [Desulfosporosinus burensis]